MQVPSTLRALWAQRTRWARGQGEVLHVHLRDVSRWRNRRMWLLAFESLASMIWIVALAGSLIITVLGITLGGEDLFGFAFAWGIAIAAIGTLQLIVALTLERAYDPASLRAFVIAAPFPLAYWLIAGAASLRAQTISLLRGPRRQRVVWDVPRERLETTPEAAKGPPSQNR